MNEIYKVTENSLPAKDLDGKKFDDLYKQSISDPEKFWSKLTERLTWSKKPTKIKSASFKGDIKIKWFEDGELNVAYNCIDRHLEKNADKVAIIWEGENTNESKKITFAELHKQVCKLSNALENLGVKKGDRVTIYLPMIPEAAYSILACARIGAVHNVIFGGFSPDSISSRIDDCKCEFVITADEGLRSGKKIPLKKNVDDALAKVKTKIRNVLVIKRTGGNINFVKGRDLWYHEQIEKASDKHEAKAMNAEDPLFILYTSGSTGTPKGVLHTSGGYLLYTSVTHEYAFGVQENDVYWCTADIGWITGHSYLIYGPLANATTTVMFEGVPTYPTASRFWEVVDKHQVNIFYTAPTAIRSLMALGDDWVKKTKRSSLRVLGSVGEPINPEAWRWYYNVVGDKRCPIIDTWWQTETGGFMITPIAGMANLKPGSATTPFFGIQPVLLDDKGNEVNGEGEGSLAIKNSWPGQMRTVYGDHKRFVETYFSQFPGYYLAGDGARRDKDGYYWVTGRNDDVIKVSGHRIGSAEVESALVSDPKVAEAAVVAIDHKIKGQSIYAYVILKGGETGSDALGRELVQHVRQEVGPFAVPDHIHFTPALPKTRSGKIMRRLLRKIANRDTENLGDTSTLMNPEIVDELINANKKLMAS